MVTFNLSHMRSTSRVYVIGVGVRVYICGKFFFASYCSDRVTFLNVRNRTSRQIYRLATPLLSPETISLFSN